MDTEFFQVGQTDTWTIPEYIIESKVQLWTALLFAAADGSTKEHSSAVNQRAKLTDSTPN